MVIKCAVLGCSNRKDREKDFQYYRLPAIASNQGEECEKLSSKRRREWLANMNQCFKNKNLDNVRICSEHFVSGKKADLYDRTNPDWCPTLRLGGSNPEPVVSTPLHSATPHVDRYKRVQERSKRKRLELIQNDEESTFESSDSGWYLH
ncbi:hypothetical protein MAR_005135 [Mya arenaria]|uniref:THAP-type domain-containing protein n=1 Tax=Mya arenaria TaxID=6604 RepID=A0ABY7EYR1_MYAAR|nr:uncharacterized protein LOC128203004 [Mya arenaria]WAR15030.1 hypothetical protein MAR_005135 [Mya arenaria]